MAKQAMDSFAERVREQINRCGIMPDGERWLLAVSGGADSVAMLHALAMLQNGGLGLAGLQVAHLNHQLRGAQSDEDAAFVQQQAQQLGLKVTIGSADVAGATKQTGESIETAARAERYRFLLETARQTGCRIIATAHTADDNVETILHRILRGTGIRGLGGMPVVRELGRDNEGQSIRLVRPLLDRSRSEVEEFLSRQGLAYRQDSSNACLKYTRNRIRHELLPLLRDEYNPNVNEALANLGHTARWLQEILEADAALAFNGLLQAQSADRLVLDAAKLASLSRIQQGQILYQALEAMGIGQRRIGFRHIKAMMDLLTKNKGATQIPRSLTVKREGDQLIFLREPTGVDKPAPIAEIHVNAPGITELPTGYVIMDSPEAEPAPLQRLHIQCMDRGSDYLQTFRRQKTVRQELLDADAIRGVLTLRPWRQGDRFAALGSVGSKTMGDFLTDCKAPREHRARIALLCDGEGIVWAMGMRIAKRVKVTDSTKRILQISVE